MATLQDFSDLLQSQPKKLYTESWRRRQIQRVPPHIRRREQLYDPVMVSLGPYHHGKPELRQAEEFKHHCLDRQTDGDEKMKAFFYSKILEEIVTIRECYVDVTIVEKYDDKSLALMMLLDASIIIDFIHNYRGNPFLGWQRCLGAGSGPVMVRDMFVMENQIPFRVLKLLISLQYKAKEAELFLPRYFTRYVMGEVDLRHGRIPQEAEDPPIHLLEALWRVLVKVRHQEIKPEPKWSRFPRSGLSMREEIYNEGYVSSCALRSVMDLKAKGIRLSPNSTRSLTEVVFRPNACFSKLELRVQDVSDLTPAMITNMIAFEVSPNSNTSLVVLSYAILMKSLIQSVEDVKEMQERGVMLNRLANLEKVVEIFKEIDTFALHDHDLFKDVKREIEQHCRSRARTWIAELIYTRFRTPWTAIAFFAAALLLCLTFLQTLFTVRR